MKTSIFTACMWSASLFFKEDALDYPGLQVLVRMPIRGVFALHTKCS